MDRLDDYDLTEKVPEVVRFKDMKTSIARKMIPIKSHYWSETYTKDFDIDWK
jgi:hypothetical protein